jgi:two-component system phosphate regulon sensor histidine kinase PhoR
MTISVSGQLAACVAGNRTQLLAQWREQVKQLAAAKHLDTPTLNDHIPQLLEELCRALRLQTDETIPEALRGGSPPAHGLQRLQDGYDLEEVVAEYNILRGCLHDLADRAGLSLSGTPFHIINRVLDGAIGLAVQTFATQKALEVQQRREEYLAFVAHDLRTPLNVMNLTVRMLQENLNGQQTAVDTARMLKVLHRNVNRLDDLVRKIMEENANLQTEVGLQLHRRIFDLWPLVESLIHDLHPVAGTNSTQLVNNVADDTLVYADASLLRRIFQNLIANAIRYTPRGQIVIEARPVDDQGTIECSVTDNGAGISEPLLEKVFDKRETDPDGDGGTGLGLAIVKTFTEAHGGTVSLESQPGAGSTFRFSLPGPSAPRRGVADS